MAIKLVKCKLSIPGAGTDPAKIYFFLSPKGTYGSSIGIACGISEAAEADFDQPNIAVKELLLSGVAQRMNVRALKAGKAYNLQLLVGRHKVATAPDALKDQTIDTVGTISTGAKIQRVINPRRATTY